MYMVHLLLIVNLCYFFYTKFYYLFVKRLHLQKNIVFSYIIVYIIV